MAITLEVYETMCAYFDGKLSLEDEKRFLELVEKDPELKKEFEWEEKMIFNSIPQYQESEVIASDAGIATYPGEIEIKPEPKPREAAIVFYKKFAIAASVIAIICIITIIYLTSKTREGNPISRYIPLIPASTDTMGPQIINPPINHQQMAAILLKKKRVNALGPHNPDLIEESPQLGQIQQAFLEKDYDEVIALAEKPFLVRGDEHEVEIVKGYALLYKGVALLSLNQDSSAAIILKRVAGLSKMTPALINEAQWNLSKALYKIGKGGEAKVFLLRLRDNQDYKANVEKLLKMIEQDPIK